MKLVYSVVLLVFLVVSPGYCFIFDLISDGLKTVNQGLNEVSDAVFKKTMVAKTIESVTTLQKNFDESVSFYNEMRMIYNNPASLTDYSRTELLRNLQKSRDYTRDLAEMNYKRSYDSKQGYIGQAFDRADRFVKQDLYFGDKMADLIKDRENTQQKIINDATKPGGSTEEQRRKLEEARLRNELLQTQLMIDLNKNMVETVKAIKEIMAASDARTQVQLKEWNDSIQELQRNIQAGRAHKYISSEDALKNLWRR